MSKNANEDDTCLEEFYDAMDSFSNTFKSKHASMQLKDSESKESNMRSHSLQGLSQEIHAPFIAQHHVNNLNESQLPTIIEPKSNSVDNSISSEDTKSSKFASKFLTKLKRAVSHSKAGSSKNSKKSINYDTNSSSMAIEPSSSFTSVFNIFKRKDKNTFFHPSGYIRMTLHKKQNIDFDKLVFVQDISYRELQDQLDPFVSIPSNTITVSEPMDSKIVQRTIWTVKFSHNGRYLAAAGQQGILWIWTIEPQLLSRDSSDIESSPSTISDGYFVLCKEVIILTGHTSDIVELSWSKNQFILTCSLDKSCRLWHPTRKECLAVFQHPAIVTSVAFHPMDDRFFISSSLDCSIKLWNIPEKLCMISRVIPDTTITAVAFAQNGKIVMAGTFGGKCYFYDTDGLKYSTQLQIRKRNGIAKQVKVTGLSAVVMDTSNTDHDEKILVTSNDSKVRLYRLRDKSLIAVFKGCVNLTSQIKAHIGDDLQYIISASENGRVVIWKNFLEEERTSSDAAGTMKPKQKMKILISAALHRDKSRQFEYFSLGSSTSSNTASMALPSNEQHRMTCAIFAPISVSNQVESYLSQHGISSDVQSRIIVCADMKGHLFIFMNHTKLPNRRVTKQDNTVE